MVYSTIHGHISVLNHHQLPSVSIWSTHTENESQDITSICWNFLWTCPVYFALQTERSKTRSEEHNLMCFNLSSHHHSATHSMSVCAPGSYLLKQKWAREPPWVHSLASILVLPHNPLRVQEEESALKEDKWRPYLHLFTILSKPKDRSMASAVPARWWVVGHPHPDLGINICGICWSQGMISQRRKNLFSPALFTCTTVSTAGLVSSAYPASAVQYLWMGKDTHNIFMQWRQDQFLKSVSKEQWKTDTSLYCKGTSLTQIFLVSAGLM